ncbi:uncharacterized protein LOC111396080 isoform X1 [Olea europaea subsp. europaea]|nr:uncharacterized protein LOC111396080 isoform X1 [Olea europaea subsp. europaea]
MGTKRPFQEDDFPELSFKHAKQLGFNNNLNSYFEDFSSCRTSPKSDTVAASNFCNYKFDERHGNSDISSYSNIDEKELEMGTALSNGSIDEDSAFEDRFCWSHFQGYFDFSVPRRLPVQFRDPYSFLLNCSPRKEIPVGRDHQAEVPPWDPNATWKDTSSPSYFVDDESEEKLMGTCIIPMPNLKFDGIKEVHGQADCNCLDRGSVKCVQQHAKEAREKLRETIGDEKFAELGFLDMGEEVASKWTEEEQQIFHQVIYSNPLLLGKNFWRHLSAVFPTRTKKEIVSYYFNVFMLRRRALQNRINPLAVNSDDDEWHGADGGFYQGGEEDEDSLVESFGDQDVHVGPGNGSSSENVCRYEVEDSGNGIFHGNGNGEHGDAIELDSKRD